MKTPNHPSSVVTPLVISQQSNMTEIKTLISQSDAIKIEPNVLKCFSLRQIYTIKKSVEDEKNSSHLPPHPPPHSLNGPLEQMQFLKRRKPKQKTIIKILSENISSRPDFEAGSDDFITILSKVKQIFNNRQT